MERITYDTPVYFDIYEVYRYIKNKNNEVINKNDTLPHLPKRSDGTVIKNADEIYLSEEVVFASTSTAKDTKASNGPYNGEFERFITRLETKLSDKRLRFITASKKSNGESFTTESFSEILKQFLGYIDKCNVTIIDLSAIPFEVLTDLIVEIDIDSVKTYCQSPELIKAEKEQYKREKDILDINFIDSQGIDIDKYHRVKKSIESSTTSISSYEDLKSKKTL